MTLSGHVEAMSQSAYQQDRPEQHLADESLARGAGRFGRLVVHVQLLSCKQKQASSARQRR